jgi:prevent-host-death family protein
MTSVKGGEIVERIPHRELRNSSAEILRRVAAGESFEITNHGDVVAVLGPPRPHMGLKVVKPATRKGGLRDLKAVKRDGPSTQEILDELREDRI